MRPFRDYELSQMLEERWTSVNNKIESMSNEEIIANDLEVLAENLYQESFIEPIQLGEELFSKRKITQRKISKYVDPFFRDVYGSDYVNVDGIIATFVFPYQGETSLFRYRASTYSLSGYPEIEISQNEVAFRYERTLNEMSNDKAKEDLMKALERDVQSIKSGISYVNSDVEAFNKSLKTRALVSLEEKRKKVESFFSISNMFEVPIEKKEYAQTHIPLKRNIVPIVHQYEKSDYYGILDDDYRDILSSIKHTGSTYERTPCSYKSMQEEDLRNTLLATLNATYKGDATGETFRKIGKTDICIERKNRAAFIAECKMWTGQKAVSEAVLQLDSYLTWRDCKTALVYFVRRKEYLKVLESAKAALEDIEGIREIKEVDKNEFACLYLSNSNPGQKVTIRVMLFNLFCSSS